MLSGSWTAGWGVVTAGPPGLVGQCRPLSPWRRHLLTSCLARAEVSLALGVFPGLTGDSASRLCLPFTLSVAGSHLSVGASRLGGRKARGRV